MSNVRLVNGLFTTPLWREPEHLFWCCYAWDFFGDQFELLKYFKYYQVMETRACCPNMYLCSQEASFCWREIGKRKKKETARGRMGRGKKRREVVALSVFPSSNPRSLF